MILKDGTVFYEGKFKKLNIYTHGKFIKGIGKRIKSKSQQIIDCKGKYIIPGVIDAHVHMREPGATHKEDFLSGSKAAAVGGVTTFLDMPNTIPPTTDKKTLNEKRKLAKKSMVNYGFFVLAGNTWGIDNIAGTKFFLGNTTGNNTQDLPALVEELRRKSKITVIHAENEQLLNYFSGIHGRTAEHHKIRDNIAAAVSMAESIVMANYYSSPLHIAHVSTKEEIELLQKIKTPNITAEATPHHLFLTDVDYQMLRSYGKMNPPLRYASDTKALWKALSDGTIDIIASDHAPHTEEEKDHPYEQAPSGVPGVQTLLPLMLNAVNKKQITLERVVQLTSTNPAKIYNIQNRGQLKKGFYADLTVIDMDKEITIKDSNQYSKCGWTPFHRKKIKGHPIITIVNGRVVYDRGCFIYSKAGQEVKFYK